MQLSKKCLSKQKVENDTEEFLRCNRKKMYTVDTGDEPHTTLK